MKKIIFLFTISIGILFIFTLKTDVVKAKEIEVYVDGAKVNYDVQPIVKNGRTLVPIRKTVETLGVNVEWNQKKQTVITTGNNTKVTLKIGNNVATKNGKSLKLDVPASVINNRTLIPLRFISEAYGYIVKYDSNNNKVLIFSSKESEQNYYASNVKVPVLMYHILNKNQNDTISVDPARFKEQMTAIKNAGYNTITVFELDDYLEKGKLLPKNPILITFDDGYISNYTEAYPVLKSLDMKATIFVIASKIFDEKSLIPGENEKITWKQAKEMKDTITIQSHTWNSHNYFKTASGKEKPMISSPGYINGKLETQKQYETRVYNDFVMAKKTIEEKLGYEALSIAYPYGGHSDDTIRLAKKAGYKLAFTVKKGLDSKGDNLLELNRITASGAYSGKELVNVIKNTK